MKIIDLRSDTVTMPTDEMREAMAKAAVGDDVYNDDPTVAALEQQAADMLGKEAALFCPSGTMANQLAIMCHTNRGDEVILSKNSHVVKHEVGGAAIISQISYAMVDNDNDFVYDTDVINEIRADDIHYPKTSLLCLENALGNGQVVPLDVMSGAYNAAKANGLKVHLDGARLFNAATALGVDAKELAKHSDSLMFCISKGLCAPIGSLLCGDASFIAKARKNRKLLGGGMRQAGIIAAAGQIALDVMTKRLHIDHDNAQYLAKELAKIDGIELDTSKVQINMVFFNINIKDFDHRGFAQRLLNKNIKINSAYTGEAYRFVTHNGIDREDVAFVIESIKSII